MHVARLPFRRKYITSLSTHIACHVKLLDRHVSEKLKWTFQKVDLLQERESFIISAFSIRGVTITVLLFIRFRADAVRVLETQNKKHHFRQPCAMTLILEICAVAIVVLLIAAALSEKLRNAVISSRTYKKAFAVHMNIFSRIHNRAVQKRKEEMFAHMKMALKDVQGDVLEIGAGTGANFEFLPEGSSIIALEPNPHMEPYLVENAEKFPHIQLKKIVPGFAENMEGIANESVEAVVCTLTLCSVLDMEAVLSEVKRVLKPVSHDCRFLLNHV